MVENNRCEKEYIAVIQRETKAINPDGTQSPISSVQTYQIFKFRGSIWDAKEYARYCFNKTAIAQRQLHDERVIKIYREV